jgi:hypothetical protein
MFNFIHPKDDSTKFLETIYLQVIEAIGSEHVKLFVFEDENEYRAEVEALPLYSNIIFLGHGRADRLYGVLAESDDPYIFSAEMNIFDHRNLLALACKSSELLKTTFRNTQVKHSIGFGYLPTTAEEVQKIRNMRTKKTSSDDIENFKTVITKCVSHSLIQMHRKGADFSYLYSYLRLLLNKELNNLVLEGNHTGTANLIYQMLYQMSYFRS